MGCVQSKKDSGDIHPNVFRVVNIDEGGAGLWSGQLEVTDAELVLYREGRDATVWPLRCLRRYGFDGEIFSFESGRRCTTGEGIYAFRCRRAGMLFRTLQQNIQLRNMVSESMPFQLPVNSLPVVGASLPRILPDVATAHLPSVAGDVIDANIAPASEAPPPPATSARPGAVAVQSPRSPSSTEILEVMPLFPLTATNANHITNLYQKQDFRMREYNNNRAEGNVEHSYSNDFNRDLAALRTTLRRETVLNTMKDIEEESNFLKSQYMNEGVPLSLNPPLSPTASDTSEHYARLSIDLGSSRPYMNLGPHDTTFQRVVRIESAATIPFISSIKRDAKPSSSSTKEEINSYANLNIGNVLDQIHNKVLLKQSVSESSHKYSESDTHASTSPVEEQEVNYAILDMESNKDETRRCTPASPDSCSNSRNDNTASPPINTCSKLATQNSIDRTDKTGVGYTTIDFDKTVALTSVASGAEVDMEGSRKTRHNSVNIVSSPNGADKNKLM